MEIFGELHVINQWRCEVLWLAKFTACMLLILLRSSRSEVYCLFKQIRWRKMLSLFGLLFF